MNDWDEILKLADQISDKKLKKMVIAYLKDPKPTHKEFKQLLNLKKAPAAGQWHHVYEGGLLRHTLAVTRIALSIAGEMEKIYKIKINKNVLLAAGLCHDLMKVCEYKLVSGHFEMKLPLPLDHLTLGVTEMYARGFPKAVIHTVAAHHGEAGPVAPNDPESIILHFADMLDAYANIEAR
jgi:7,8-dihydroneopterin 2',3'-cyclic phosphate phosphodiesterase